MSDALLIFGLVCLIVCAFLVSVVTGFAVVGVSCVLLSLALADGKGFSWRS